MLKRDRSCSASPPTEEIGRLSYFIRNPSAHLRTRGDAPDGDGRPCTSLPDEARTRTYAARVVPVSPGSRTSFLVRLSAARFLSTRNQASIAAAGDFARVVMSVSTNAQSDSSPGIVEQLRETTYLAIDAGAEGTFDASGMTAPLDGYFEYCPGEAALIGEDYRCLADAPVTCSSRNHQLTLAPR